MSDQISGQIVCTTAGVAVQGPNTGPGDFLIRRHPANTGTYVYMGNNGSDSINSTTGIVTGAGDSVCVTVKSLNELWFTGDTNGDKVCWFRMFSGHV